MAVVVSDASVLIGLAAVRQFGLLSRLYGQVIIPEAVWREVVNGHGGSPGVQEANAARDAGWLHVVAATNRPLVTQLETTLDAGEAEAIALAVERAPCLLLLDESDGRRIARSMGVTLTGTLGVLLRAKAQGHLPALKPTLTELIERQNFRLHPNLYRQVLIESGEQP